jgi:translation initiation factor 1
MRNEKKIPDSNRVVYSTAQGRMCLRCGRPAAVCVCVVEKPVGKGDGVVRIRLEKKGRGGKMVTTVSGVPLDVDGIESLASELKRKLGTGGTVSGGVIEIQGDRRDALFNELTRREFRVKKS